VVQLPTTAEAAALLLVHRLLLRARGEPSARVLRLSGDDASALASLSLTEEIERQAASGWTRRTADAQFYRPTWKGAALLSWNRLWPITAARRARLLRREREILAQALSSGPEPAPAGLAPS